MPNERKEFSMNDVAGFWMLMFVILVAASIANCVGGLVAFCNRKRLRRLEAWARKKEKTKYGHPTRRYIQNSIEDERWEMCAELLEWWITYGCAISLFTLGRGAFAVAFAGPKTDDSPGASSHKKKRRKRNSWWKKVA